MLDVPIWQPRKSQLLAENTVHVMLDVHLTGTRKKGLQILSGKNSTGHVECSSDWNLQEIGSADYC